MIARMTRGQILCLLFTLALSFAVAACAAQQAGTTRPGGAQGQSGETETTGSGSSATPPGATESAPRSSMDRERTPLGDTVEIRRAWVQVRSQPSKDARAIALVFGNDRLAVMDKQGDWVRVRLDGRREGWIPAEVTEDP